MNITRGDIRWHERHPYRLILGGNVGVDSRNQIFEIEWLGNVFFHSQFFRVHHCLHIVERGQEDHGDILPIIFFFHLTKEIESIDSREFYVRKDQIGVVIDEFVEGILSAGNADNLETLFAQ